jgi:hypothetical protein
MTRQLIEAGELQRAFEIVKFYVTSDRIRFVSAAWSRLRVSLSLDQWFVFCIQAAPREGT